MDPAEAQRVLGEEHDRIKQKLKVDRKQPMTEAMNDWAERCGEVRYDRFRKAAAAEYVCICCEQNRLINVFHGKRRLSTWCLPRSLRKLERHWRVGLSSCRKRGDYTEIPSRVQVV